METEYYVYDKNQNLDGNPQNIEPDKFFFRIKKEDEEYSVFNHREKSFLFFSDHNFDDKEKDLSIPLKTISSGIVFMDFTTKTISGFAIDTILTSGSRFYSLWGDLLLRSNIKSAVLNDCFQNYRYKDQEIFMDLKGKLESSTGFINLGAVVSKIVSDDDSLEDYSSEGFFNIIPQDWDSSAFYIHQHSSMDNLKKFLTTATDSDIKQIKCWSQLVDNNRNYLFYNDAVSMAETLNQSLKEMAIKEVISPTKAKHTVRF